MNDENGHLAGKPLQPHNTPIPSDADYSRYQRTTTPDTSITTAASSPSTTSPGKRQQGHLPKPKPPAKHNKHGSSQYGRNSDASVMKYTPQQQKNSHNNNNQTHNNETNILTTTTTTTKHKQGNDILTVEIDRKEKKQRTKSSDVSGGADSAGAGGREGGRLRRRSLKNSQSAAVSGSSQDRDIDAEYLPPGERSGGRVQGEYDPSWLMHSKK